MNGRITSWNDERGYGFITPVTGGKQIFVHIKAFSNRYSRPEAGQSVTYSLSTDKRGRSCAVNVNRSGDRLRSAKKGKRGSLQIIGASLFLIIVAVAVFTAKLPPLILFLYLIASPLTFIMYATDKSAAKTGAWRTPESTLHLLSLVGGWPGAIVAQQTLRHKSSKASFRTVFWITVVLNCGVFIWLFTPTGAAALHSLLAL